jgi:hypothetical protein
MIEQGAELSVTRQCELLDLNRSGVYYMPRPISDQDLRLMRRIDELHLEHPFYGARRLAKQLEWEGYEVGRLGGFIIPTTIKHRTKSTTPPMRPHRLSKLAKTMQQCFEATSNFFLRQEPGQVRSCRVMQVRPR